MAERRKDAEFRSVADQDVEPAPAVEDGGGELVDLDEVAQIHRHQGGGAARGSDRVVDFFEAADSARRHHDMRALTGKAHRNSGADAARGARDQGDLAGKPAGHQLSRRAARRCTTVSATMLNSAVAIR